MMIEQTVQIHMCCHSICVCYNNDLDFLICGFVLQGYDAFNTVIEPISEITRQIVCVCAITGCVSSTLE